MSASKPQKRQAGAIASYIYSILQIIIGLLYVPLLLNGIGQSEYGLYQLVGSIIAYLSIINSTFSAGATRYYTKFYVLGDKEGMANTLGILKRIYRIAYIIVFVATFAAMGIFGFVYKSSLTAWEIRESCFMLLVLAANLSITMYNTISIACITAHEDFVFLKVSQLATLVMQPILVLILIGFMPYALTVTLVQLVCNLLCCILQHTFATTKLHMDSKMRFLDKDLEKHIVVFSSTVVLATIADQLFWRSDQLILSYFYGTSTTAVYAVASQVVNGYLPLGLAISSVFMPRISELWHKDHDLQALSKLFIQVSRVTLYVLLAVLFGFIIFGQDFVRLWAGEGYGDAYWVAVIELVPFTVDVAQNIGLTILQVMNRYGFRAKMYFVAALINIAMTIWLAQSMGSIGAAIASGVAMLVSSGFILNWYYQKRIGLDMKAWWKSIASETLPLVLLCVVGCFAWTPFRGGDWFMLVTGLVVWAIAFTVVSYFVCSNPYERDLVKSFVVKLTGHKSV